MNQDITIAAFLLIGAYVLYELVFWIVDTVIFKAIFGERQVPHFIASVRKMGFRLSYICLLGGLGMGLVALPQNDVVFVTKPLFLQLSAVFAALSILLYLAGMWYKRVEIRNL